MDRLNKIQDYLKHFRVMWIGQKIEMCRKQPNSNLLELTEQLLSELRKEQEQDRGQNFCYLALFHFRSSVLTGMHQYQICAMDETLYLNPPLVSKSWVPEEIYNDGAALRNAVEKELRKYFVRLLSFEIDFAVRVVLEDYRGLAEVCWKQAANKIILGETFQLLQKHNNWHILSGTYMDDTRVILQSQNGR